VRGRLRHTRGAWCTMHHRFLTSCALSCGVLCCSYAIDTSVDAIAITVVLTVINAITIIAFIVTIVHMHRTSMKKRAAKRNGRQNPKRSARSQRVLDAKRQSLELSESH